MPLVADMPNGSASKGQVVSYITEQNAISVANQNQLIELQDWVRGLEGLRAGPE